MMNFKQHMVLSIYDIIQAVPVYFIFLKVNWDS